MSNPRNSFVPQHHAEPEPGCPFRWQCRAAAERGRPLPAPDTDSAYIQARRQGIYLAACVIDEVAALELRSPQEAIDEIRRRICQLVHHELSANAARR